jgi:hypothetical protein
MYENIENIFEYILPDFEGIWSWIKTMTFTDVDYLRDPKKPKILKKYSLKNKNLQVITKIVKISLDSRDDLQGAWHIEGMPHEHIVATASCTLYQDENFDACLSFKRIYTSEEGQYLVQNVSQNPIKEIYDLVYNAHVPLGKYNLKKNTLIVFPNCNIHKVDMINNGVKKQSRLIIVFWLINPEIKITSTQNIKQQNYPLSKAYENRLNLMKERSIHKQTLNQRDINLCEH